MGNCHPEKTNVDRGAVDMFFWNTTRRQVISSHVRAWFHDSAGDIDFYQMSLSQSE